MPSENGWEPARARTDQCQWVRIPGAEHVSLQILKGQPLAILRAFAADYHAYIEPLRDADSACWTPTNSVPTSNHLNGTGMDLNWNGADGKTFRLGISEAAAYPGDKARKLRELLDWYEDTVFCGGNWSIRDWMHFQMGGNTYQNPRTADFIARKIRPDGFSTFRRGAAPTSPAAADVLARATGLTVARAGEILSAVRDGLVQSQCTNPNRIAMWLAQVGHESAGLRYMEEIADGSAYEGRDDLGNTVPGDGRRFKGRGPIQVTGRSNYTELSKWAHGRGLVPSPTFFVDQPAQLASDRYGFIGVTWYWTTQRPMNTYADRRDIEGASIAVNGRNRTTGRANGIEDRIARYQRALAVGDALLALTTTESRDPLEELLMLEVHSWSIYAKPGEVKIPVHRLIQALDAHGPHEPYWEQRARGGDPEAIQDLARVAVNGPWNFDLNRYVDDPVAKRQALGVLLEIQAAHPEWITAATPGKA